MSLQETDKIRQIKGVQFSIISSEEIKRRSVVNVTETILYDNNGDPVINGLFDPRMGVIDHGKICPTDGLDNKMCPGYFGHIELAKPCFHTQFMDITMLTLKSICIKCSKLLIDKNDPKIKDTLESLEHKKRSTYIASLSSKIKICGTGEDSNGCGALQPTRYVKDGLSKVNIFWKDTLDDLTGEDKKQVLNAEKVLKLFKHISDEDAMILGLDPRWCKPEWLICTNLPVSPPAVRPSVRQANGQRSEDDITHKLIDIIKTNNHLKKKLLLENSLETTIDEWSNVLQYHVSTLVDNNLPGINQSTHRSGRALKTIRERLKGKEGRIRGNLMGKRVDHSARSVITPDPNIKINELGVPFKIALNLTIPEVVNKYNIGRLTLCVRNGPYKHPGAKSIKRKIDKDKQCMGRKIDREQCTRSRREGSEFCKSHEKTLKYGRIDDESFEDAPKRPRGRKRKEENSEYIATKILMIDNIKHLIDSENNVYTYNIEQPKILGKYDHEQKLIVS
mgnify:CR=1 FL=1